MDALHNNRQIPWCIQRTYLHTYKYLESSILLVT